MDSHARTLIAQTLDNRLAELQDSYDEYMALTAAKRELKLNPRGRKPKNSNGNGNTPEPMGSDSTHARKGETLIAVQKLIANHPEGITVQQIADTLERKPSYIYTVTSRLVDRKVAKRSHQKIFPATTVRSSKKDDNVKDVKNAEVKDVKDAPKARRATRMQAPGVIR